MTKHQEIINEDICLIVKSLGNLVDKFSGKTILITGPNGLLASYLVDTVAYLNDNKMLKRKCKIIGLQRSKITRKDRLGHLLKRNDIKIIQHDVTKPYTPKQKVHYIVHSAGRSAPAVFQSDPLGTVDVNVKGIRWILEYARKSKPISILYMSSGEIYGNPTSENIPTPETYKGNVSTLAPRACYTESKRLAETLCSIYFTKFNVPIKIARPFIVYGPGLPIEDRRVIADFMRSGIEGKPIEMLNEGLDTRSYCYIADATTLFWKMLFSDKNCEPYNVASDLEEISIKKLAETVHEICQIKKPVGIKITKDIKFVKDAPTKVAPDISKAKKDFKYKPRVLMKEGLKRTIEWNKARLGTT